MEVDDDGRNGDENGDDGVQTIGFYVMVTLVLVMMLLMMVMMIVIVMVMVMVMVAGDSVGDDGGDDGGDLQKMEPQNTNQLQHVVVVASMFQADKVENFFMCFNSTIHVEVDRRDPTTLQFMHNEPRFEDEYVVLNVELTSIWILNNISLRKN